MLTREDMLVIQHCHRAKIPRADIAGYFGKSIRTVSYVVAMGNLLHDSILADYFQLGIRAEKIASELRSRTRISHNGEPTEPAERKNKKSEDRRLAWERRRERKQERATNLINALKRGNNKAPG